MPGSHIERARRRRGMEDFKLRNVRSVV